MRFKIVIHLLKICLWMVNFYRDALHFDYNSEWWRHHENTYYDYHPWYESRDPAIFKLTQNYAHTF